MSGFDWLRFSMIATSSALAFYTFLILLLFPSIKLFLLRIISLPKPSTQHQIAALDTVRGLAAASVVIAHAWNFCNPIFNKTQMRWFWFLGVCGDKAVPVFVVLSGFLIYRTVKRINTTDDLRIYIQKRFFRIYPVYIVTVALGFLLNQASFSIANLLNNVFMVRTICPAYLPIVDPPSWSLYVEILFYIVLPIWVSAFRKHVFIGSMVSFIVLLFVDPLASRELWIWKYFFIGVFTSEFVELLKKYIKEWQAIVVFFVGIILILLDFKINRLGKPMFDWFDLFGIVPSNPAKYTVGLGIACMFTLTGIYHSKKIAKLLGFTPLRILGIISYSLYLIHPFFLYAVFPNLDFRLAGQTQHLLAEEYLAPAWFLPFVMFPGALTWGIICFLLVERPFLFLGSRTRTKVYADALASSNESYQMVK